MNRHRSARIGVVVNPTAGRGHGLDAGRRAVTLLDAAGHDVVNLSATTAAGALENARAAVRGTRPEAAGGPVDALVVVGGDGMTHLGVNAVAGTTVPLGLVAAGSGNDAARELGLPVRDVRTGVRALLDALAAGPRTIDAASVVALGAGADGTGGTEGGAPARWFCGVLSAGLDAAVNARANEIRWPRGRASYVRAVGSELRRFAPYGYRVTTEDRTWDSPGTLVAVANGPAIGGGIRIAPGALFDDGLLDVVVAAPFGRLRAASIFPGMYRGRHLGVEGIESFRARRVTLEPTGAGALPPEAFADGERIGPLPLRVEVVPGALRVLAPPVGAARP
ncbi:diacylglycerol kinase family protein [Cellulomonas sp. PhB143]|uniref:diacylglycerol/lipid kinase family protein n=1 Tax=Cellulomonas sp. PhB143 TaxID=2485186 RepID=UPI000F469E94|nr:diacylglycerol kinase family protein [Cellulomonas sp. PhB143]ROS74482.1 diacylglycerol kinase [Cellulomonas sp. PhB143]